MADAAVEFLLENLQQLLLYHVHLIKDAKEQVERLERDLRLFKSFLKDSSKKRRREDSLRELVCQIRDVVYEAEDVIDAFVTQATESRSKNYFVRAFQTPVKLLTIAKEVEKVGSKIRDIYGDKGKFDFASLNVGDGGPEESEVPVPRQDDVVGFEDEAEKIIGYIMEDRDELDVISIIGMPGLGKTTLAWKIFHDPNIQYEFLTRIWVYVSQEFTKKDVFLAILKELIARPTEDLSQKTDNELARLVSDHLQSRRFLIVMDDVWTSEDWDKIKIALPKTSKMGKVLITSRHKEVAWHANRVRGPHNLRFLTQEESELLLQLEVFGRREWPSINIEVLGKVIAEQCGGLPLAIVVIGGILAKKFSASHEMSAKVKAWDKVSQSVGRYLTEEDPTKRMEKIIALSYDKLPFHLRACFLYFGMFPEDFEILAWKLIRMWIAEGFIQPKTGLNLEETAESYLEELINRNLVRVDTMKPDGKVKTCRIHDMLRDFCKSEAGHAKEKFLQEMKKTGEGDFEPAISNAVTCRRLCIHSNISSFVSSKPFGPHVRSFVCFSKEEINLPPEHCSSIPAGFKLLRVLEVKPIKMTKIPSDLYHLVHLRYITLSCTLGILPAAFYKLWNLQTLVVDTTSRTLDVKADIWKLLQLRHLKTNACTILPKSGKIGTEGEKLQMLSTISPLNCSEDVLDKCCNLKKLGIRGRLSLLLDGKTGSFESLGRLHSLERLKLVNDVFPSPPSEGQLGGLPPTYQFPPKLRILTLADTFLDWSHMPTLGLLGNLEVLKLKDNAFKGKNWSAIDGGFRHLEVLHIGRTDLVVWKASAYHFPRLRCLMLRNCEKLQEIPIELADIPSFELLDLYRTQCAAVSAKKIQEKKTEDAAVTFKLSVFPPVNDHHRGRDRDTMADIAVENLLENLGQLLLHRVDLINDVKKEMEQLERDLRLFKSFLKDSSKKRRREDSLRELVCQIRDVVYEAEDVIDAFVTQATESRTKSYFARAFKTPVTVELLTISKEVEKVGSKVSNICDDDKGKIDFASLNVGDGIPEESEAPRVRQKNVVGFEDERSEIVRYLTQETEKPDVITLVGMPGIGKTTLAWKIFDDPEIHYAFPTRIWVHVSDEFTRKDVFLAILRELTTITNDVKGKSEKELEEVVLSHLKKTKFLIVLDDVWSVSDWNSLRIVIPTSKRGKVLITSCNDEVGRCPYNVRFLTESESWELLQLEVLGEATKCPPQLETVGKLIAKQCDGLPLAILTMGGILVREDLSCVDINERKTAWTRACQSLPKYRYKNFYNSMPHRLQHCFLYLAAFPYDFEIPVGQLIRLWIAEGFVENVDGVCLEETAESYVKNLISRNLLKVCQRKDDGTVKKCLLVHRMLHDFCKTEAGDQRENVLTEFKFSDGVFEPPLSRVSECRRLSIHSNVSDFLSSPPFSPRTRAFVCLSKEEICLTAENVSTIPAAFKLIRVLDVKPIKLHKIPSDFYHLVSLRYLALSLGQDALYPAFKKLWNIQTLLVDTTSGSLDIKVDIFEFAQLRHFKTNVPANLCKPGKGSKGGEELQSLGMIAPESCREAMMEKAHNLKKLGIQGKLLLLLDEKNGSFDCLVKLNYLEKLKLVNDAFPLPPSVGGLRSLPPANKFPPSLKRLTLAATYLDWSHMRILTGLPNLEVLKLKDNAFVGQNWVTEGDFESLVALHIGHTDLVIWVVASAHQFPRLKSLKLRHCEKLKGVPIELADIPTLQILNLFETKLAAPSTKEFLEKKDAKEFRLSIYSQVQYE